MSYGMKPLFKRLQIPPVLCGLLMLTLTACSDDSTECATEPVVASVWTDPQTGLIWQADLPETYATWRQAVDYCDTLNLDGQQDWRLPHISELRTLLSGCAPTVTGGECGVDDTCIENDCQTNACYACAFGDGPMNGCYARAVELDAPCEHYWSADRVPDVSDRAWAIGFAGGFIYKPRIYYSFHARCVRGVATAP